VTEIRRLTTLRALREAGGSHPVLRWDVGPSLLAPSYAVGEPGAGAVAYVRRGQSGAQGGALLGTTDGIALLLEDPDVRELVTHPEVTRVSAPADAYDLVADRLSLSQPSSWEWMWTRTAPAPVPAEELILRLGPDRKADLRTFLDLHNPRTFGQPYERPAQLWVGIQDTSGTLVACGCSEPNSAGVLHLAGITVDPAHRGQGLGSAVTAHLTREALVRGGVCTLGMYADNTTARRVYRRLGYLTAVTWTTGRPPGA